MRAPKGRAWLKTRWPKWLRRKMTYKANHALHVHEDRVLMELIRERGVAQQVWKSPLSVATTWCWQDKGRWDRHYLVMAFKRLAKSGELRQAAAYEREKKLREAS